MSSKFEFKSAETDPVTENIRAHVAEKKTVEIGNKGSIAKLRNCSFGCENVEIGRPVPPIEIILLALEKGGCYVLIGANGSGKSTIFDSVMDQLGNDAILNTGSGEGAIVYGKPVHAREKLRISRLNQEELLGSIKEMSVVDVIEKAIEKFKAEFVVDWENADKVEENIQNDAAQQRIEELQAKIIELFNIDDFLERQVKELSGGEKTKLSIFMTLLSEPDVLLLDEPTNHLDLESISKLMTLFKSYNDVGVSILCVSHVDWFLQEAGRNGVFEIVSDGTTRKVEASKAPYRTFKRNKTRKEFTVVNRPLAWKNLNRVKQGVCLSPKTETISIPESPLNEVTLESLMTGDVWFLSGNNGSGKTKLMEALAEPAKRRSLFTKEKGINIAYMPQFWPEQVANGTLEDFFYYVKDQINPHSPIVSRNLTDAIREVGFMRTDFGSKKIDRNWLRRPLASFSGGEQRLLWFLAVSCFDDVDVLMLDEPTNHMDQNLQEFVLEAMRSFSGAIIFSSHDRNLIEKMSQNVGEKVNHTMVPKNLVLEKEEGVTTIRVSKESPIAYIKSVRKKAQNQAKKLKV